MNRCSGWSDRRRVTGFIAAAGLGLGCVHAPPLPGGHGSPAVLDARFPDGRTTLPLAALAGRERLAPGQEFVIEELGRDAGSSHHLVWIRDREVPHRHDRHDLLVVMLRGFGTMRLGDAERA